MEFVTITNNELKVTHMRTNYHTCSSLNIEVERSSFSMLQFLDLTLSSRTNIHIFRYLDKFRL